MKDGKLTLVKLAEYLRRMNELKYTEPCAACGKLMHENSEKSIAYIDGVGVCLVHTSCCRD